MLLVFSLALISHTLYLANYIKTHETEFAKIDQLESELITAEAKVAALSKKNTDLISANLPTIAAFEDQALAALRSQTVSHTALSRGSNDSRGLALEEIASQDDLSLADHEKLLQLIYDTAVNNANQLARIPSILPLKGSTYVTSPYGYRRNPFGGRSKEFHDGVDFAANYGTPVYATADGIVSFAGWDYGYGRKIVINHGNGIITFYGHNSKLLVSTGAKVKKGDMIAYSGNTGRSSGPHLHYGAYVNGKSVNPLTFTNK
ncbi:MAG: M23 family metallopeptidase [Peptococcaceae bacterium]|nr:M23 family metallopeptidase [Peptococcaceae bacterium]